MNSQAWDASADGSVVVGSANGNVGSEAFVWDAAFGMRELSTVLANLGVDTAGWQLTEAVGVSDDGRTVVGVGLNPSGFTEAWIAVIPEPGTGTLVGTGLFCLAIRRKPRDRPLP